MIKEWTENPSKGVVFFNEREQARLEAERLERVRKEEEERILRERREEAARLEAIRREEERKRQEEQRRKEEEQRRKAAMEAEVEKLRLERERFPEGRVRVTIEQVSWTQFGAAVGTGNMLDAKLQSLQDQGCQIMNVTCYASGDKAAYVQAVIVYRDPPA